MYWRAIMGRPETDIRHRCADATRATTSVRLLVRKLGRWALGGPVAGLKIGFGLAGGLERRHLLIVPPASHQHVLHFGAVLEVGSAQVFFGRYGSPFPPPQLRPRATACPRRVPRRRRILRYPFQCREQCIDWIRPMLWRHAYRERLERYLALPPRRRRGIHRLNSREDTREWP